MRWSGFLAGNEFHVMMRSRVRRVTGAIGAIAYAPLSPSGPSTSMPSVRPSAENEWQLAQVGMSRSTTRLSRRETSRSRHAISGSACSASGLITFFSVRDGISGTSR